MYAIDVYSLPTGNIITLYYYGKTAKTSEIKILLDLEIFSKLQKGDQTMIISSLMAVSNCQRAVLHSKRKKTRQTIHLPGDKSNPLSDIV